jgi:hypothetical protein
LQRKDIFAHTYKQKVLLMMLTGGDKGNGTICKSDLILISIGIDALLWSFHRTVQIACRSRISFQFFFYLLARQPRRVMGWMETGIPDIRVFLRHALLMGLSSLLEPCLLIFG